MVTIPGILAVLGASLAVALMMGAALSAAAEPVACPVAPSTGTTDEGDVHELRELRREQAQSCDALVDGLDRIAGRVQSGTTDVVAGVQAFRDGQVGRDPDHPSYSSPATAASASTGPTGPQEVSLVEDNRAEFSGNVEALRSDLWFLAGLVTSLPFGFFFLRTVLT